MCAQHAGGSARAGRTCSSCTTLGPSGRSEPAARRVGSALAGCAHRCVSASAQRGSARAAPETPMPAPTRGSRRSKMRRRAAARVPWRAAPSQHALHTQAAATQRRAQLVADGSWRNASAIKTEESATFWTNERPAPPRRHIRRPPAEIGKETLASFQGHMLIHACLTAQACPQHPLDLAGLAPAAAPNQASPVGAGLKVTAA